MARAAWRERRRAGSRSRGARRAGPNAGNGYDGEKYSWEQTLKDLTIYVPVPAAVKSKDIVCDIDNLHIKFGVKGRPPVINVRVRGHLVWFDLM